jgi:RecG-like helicase
LPRLKLADLARDEELLLTARTSARELIASDPRLVDSAHARLRELLLSDYREPLTLALAG